MFCPKCGNSDQTPETYCRRCGTYLPDLSAPLKKQVRPEDHVQANLVLSAMTAVACFTLSVLLYSTLAFKPDTHWLIYATAGVLIAMGMWQAQTFWRAMLLRKHFKNASSRSDGLGPAQTAGALPPEPEIFVPASVTDHTTHRLEAVPRSTKSKQ